VEWRVEYTDEFDAWWGKLSEEAQVVVAAKVELLESTAPASRRGRIRM
jgi:hypothetical protein